MSDASFLKCSCRHCGGHIEFPEAGVGLNIDCPHCGQKTVLTAESRESPLRLPVEESPAGPTQSESQPRKRVGLTVAVAATLVMAGGIGVGYWYLQNHRGNNLPATTDARTVAPETGAAPSATDPRTQVEAPAPTQSAAQAIAAKSLDDLKVGPITFEKGKGTSLVYAVGVLKNSSEHQRFGIKIEIDLSDPKGEKVGTAKDYRAVLEPRQDWRFRALILDNRATSARLASIEEDQ